MNSFKNHSHFTQFSDVISQFKLISASIIQGSSLGHICSDCIRPSTGYSWKHHGEICRRHLSRLSCRQRDVMCRQSHTRRVLSNGKHPVTQPYIVCRDTVCSLILPLPVPRFEDVEFIQTLGVTVSRRFTLTQHVDNLLAACAQTLFA
jgi:hypothetical protein